MDKRVFGFNLESLVFRVLFRALMFSSGAQQTWSSAPHSLLALSQVWHPECAAVRC